MRALERRICERLTLFIFVFGELDDQDGVLGGQTDEHDQPNLRINIVFDLNQVRRYKITEHHAAQPKYGERSKNSHRRAKQDTEGQRPTFV